MKKKLTRIFHPWWDWECYKAGFYNAVVHGISREEAEARYRDFLADLDAFGKGMDRVMAEWPNSCEQFLLNVSMNRVAWLGQASMCIVHGIPSCYRGGFKLLSEEQQDAANALAQKRLEEWETA